MVTRALIIENAKKWLGTPYVWGGESLDEGGFDCSGFLYNVLNGAGYKVSRKTASGYSKLGKEVAYKNAKEGDLLFFGTASITHCAVYAGNGKMYESIGNSKNTKTNKGKGVTLSNVSRRSDLKLVKQIVEEQTTTTVTTTEYYSQYTGSSNSLVDALKAVGEKDTSYVHRKTIAKANGITGYTGSTTQNSTLLSLLKKGKLIKA